ncbi:hypothetical protein JXC34_05340 [Candidatus Woesearchaeota archaeon]|nr:hypothetical protein [Candidatus Woesearchaeota archaeon]
MAKVYLLNNRTIESLTPERLWCILDSAIEVASHRKENPHIIPKRFEYDLANAPSGVYPWYEFDVHDVQGKTGISIELFLVDKGNFSKAFPTGYYVSFFPDKDSTELRVEKIDARSRFQEINEPDIDLLDDLAKAIAEGLYD